MKKILLLALCLLSFCPIHAQVYTAGHITATVTDSMSYDSIRCSSSFYYTYHITVDSSYVSDSLKIIDTVMASVFAAYGNTTGVSPWIFDAPLSQGYGDYPTAPGMTYYTGPTTKLICGLDTLRYITPYDSFMVTPCGYNNVSGQVYADNNGNCIFDSGDAYIYPPPVAMSENLSSSVGTRGFAGLYYGTGSGGYSFQVQQSWMINYSVFLPSYFAFIFPPSSCFSGSYTFTTLPQTGVDFPLQCTSNVDVQCYALAPSSIRLHRAFYMSPYVSNTGCDTAAGQLTFIKDSRVLYDPSLSTYPADTVRGDTLIWNYSGLTNLTSGAYWNCFLSSLFLSLDTTVVVGDTLCFSGYTNIPSADINPSNNSFSYCIPVVYSYDPNLKEVSPKGTGAEGYIPAAPDTLTYTLHFQNTGSAAAENIKIIDTLSSHINRATLKILGTSHNMIPEWLAPGVVQFNFNEINLPDSGTNFAASQGEVRFSVVLNPGLAYNTQIKNTGYIYFDLNPPVVTNTTLNTIAKPNRVDPIMENIGILIYPNPASDHIIVENLNGGILSITNLNGDLVFEQELVNDKTSIDVSKLTSGVYILKTISSKNTATTKFIKY